MNKLKTLLVPLTLALAIAMLPVFQPVRGPADPRLYANPPSRTAYLTVPGQNYTFDVMLENATAVTTVCFSLSFDPLKVNVTKISLGDAIPGGSLIIADWNSTAGVITDVTVTVMGISYDVDNDTVVTVTVSVFDFVGETGTIIDIRDMSCWDWYLNQFLVGDSPYDHTIYSFPAQTSLYASPASKNLGETYPPIGSVCSFDVILENASDVMSIGFSISFDPAKVNVTTITKGDALPGCNMTIEAWDPVAGVIENITLYVTGTGYYVDKKTVATISVRALGFTEGVGTLVNVYDVSCLDKFNNEFLSGDCPWDHTVYIYDPGIRDAAVIDLRILQTAVYSGDVARIDVDIQNQGNREEELNTTLYADVNTTIIGDEAIMGSRTVTLRPFKRFTFSSEWDTLGVATGNYTLTAIVDTLLGEVDLEDNNLTKGVIQLFQILPCPDVTVTCPTAITVNPSIFAYSAAYQARLINIGNVTIRSAGFEGGLRVLGSRNGTIRLCVNQPDLEYYVFYLPLYEEVQVPIWLMFQPETHWGDYVGNYTLQITVCGTHRRQLLISNIDITVCQNGAYIVKSETATFTWTLTGGSLVYLEAETDLPPGWTYTTDPEIGAFFETPQNVTVTITAAPDAREGDCGIVKLRAYKNSTGALIWDFIYFASTDNNPPTIESTETPTLSPDGTLLFNTTAKDKSGIDNVMLFYAKDGGLWENHTMDWACGDTFNSTQYILQENADTIPKTIQYYIVATDWFGNQTQSEIHSIDVMNDIAINETAKHKTVIDQGGVFMLNLSIANQGSLPLDFVNVAVYINSSILEMQSLQYMTNGAAKDLCLAIDTSTLPKGSYVITVYALCIPGEEDTVDNTILCSLKVTIVGDFSGDFKVGPADFALLSAAYGSTSDKPKWNPNCDVNNDAKVGPADFAQLSAHYGQHYP